MNKRICGYILKSYFRKKREAMFGILGITICVAGFIGGGLLLSNYIQLNIAQKKDFYGTQNAILLNASDEELARLQANAQIQKIGTAHVFATSEIPNSVLQNKIYYGYLDQNAAEQSSLRTISGRMPETCDEIALEKTTITRLGMEDPIGKKIEFMVTSLNPFSEQAGGRYFFTIVGIVKNYSELQGSASAKKNDEFALPNAFLSPEHPICKNGLAAKQLYLNTASGADVRQAVNSDSLRLNEAVYPENSFYLFLSDNDSVNLIFLALTVFLFLICILGLYSNMKATKTSRKENMMQLKCIGAGNRFLLLHYFLQDSLSLLIALPAGLLAGILCSNILFQKISAAMQFATPFRYDSSVILAALTGSVLLFYLWTLATTWQDMQQRPMSASSIGSQQQGGSKLPIFKKFPLLSWGLKSTLYHSHETANMIFAFALCFIALLSGVTLTRVMRDNMHTMEIDYSASFADGNYYSLAQIQHNPFVGFDGRDLQRFENNSEAKNTWKFSSFPVKLLLRNNVPGDPSYKEMRTSSLQEAGSFDPETLRDDLAAYQYTVQDTLYSQYINGLDSSSLHALRPYLEAGAIDTEALKTGKQIILLTSGNNPAPFQVGEQLHFTQIIRSNRSNPEDLSAKRIDFSVVIGAIVKIKSEGPLHEMFGQNVLNFLWHEDAFSAYQLPMKTNYLYIELHNPELYERTEILLEELKTLYPASMIYAQPQFAEANQKQMTGITWVCSLAVILITLLGLFQMITMAFQKTKRQANVWGALRAIGVERSQATGYQISELMFIALTAWLIGILLSVIICYGLYYGADIDVMRFFPWGISIIALLCLWILCIPIGIISINGIYKKDIVALLTQYD